MPRFAADVRFFDSALSSGRRWVLCCPRRLGIRVGALSGGKFLRGAVLGFRGFVNHMARCPAKVFYGVLIFVRAG